MSLSNIGELEREACLVIGQPVRKIRPANEFTSSPSFRWKSIINRVLAAILLIPGLPIIAFLVLLVRLTSQGPGIYRQLRVGKSGRKFNLYKIRTMTHDAEERTGPVWARIHDPRITPVGRFLRKFHLDEFPQLFNVLSGHMSLVGPRPERPDFVHVLAEQVPGYLDRLAVPPGITGLAQLNLPPDTDVENVHRKVALDLEYIENGGLLLDVRVLLCTFARLFKFPEGPVILLFGLKRHATNGELYVSGSNRSDAFDHSQLSSPMSIAGQAVSHRAGGNGQAARHGKGRSPDDIRTAVRPKPR